MYRYENIAVLVAQMESNLESQGYFLNPFHTRDTLSVSSFFWVCNDRIFSQQKGVFRVNCADCLDRTNVVQVRRYELKIRVSEEYFSQRLLGTF